jgi:hypothetical protein
MSRTKGNPQAMREFDRAAHDAAAEAARAAYDDGKQRSGSSEGYYRANRTYRDVYEREAGRPFVWFEGFPGIWKQASEEATA